MAHSGKIIVNFLRLLGLEAACDFCVFGDANYILQHWKSTVSFSVFFEPSNLWYIKKEVYWLFLKDNNVSNVTQINLPCDLIWYSCCMLLFILWDKILIEELLSRELIKLIEIDNNSVKRKVS